MKYIILLSCLFFILFSCQNKESNTFYIDEFGAISNDPTINTTTAVNYAIKALHDMDSAVLVFPKGIYHFWVDSVNDFRKAFDLQKLKKLKVDGQGSRFIFHGPLMIGSIDSCENIKMENFEIDWQRPYITQGVVKSCGEQYIDLEIDKKEYPYCISEGDSLFHGIGEGWNLGVACYNLYDKDKQEIVYRTRDMPLGNEMFVSKSYEVSPGIVRFKGKMNFTPDIGTYVALWHGRYMIEGFNMFGSKNISFKDINIYHCPSHGLVGVRCENISIKNVNMKVNREKGRVFSLIADAFHFNACRGLIEIDSCTHTGHGDDFINVHGMYVEIAKIISENQFMTGTSMRQYMTIGEGDKFWFIKHKTLNREDENEIVSISDTLNDNNKPCKLVTLKLKIPDWVTDKDFIENKSYISDFIIRNCNILKKHRARGILVTTPGKVVIENNYFRTAGAAILIEGDTERWYESGGCRDVQIRNNVFEDCFTSGHEWGEAVITITPSFRPQSDTTSCYHKNIHIKNNVFRHFDYSLLYARAVDGIYFQKNKIERTYNYKPFYRKVMFYFDGCKDIRLSGNDIGKDVLGKNIVLEHTKETELKEIDTNLVIER